MTSYGYDRVIFNDLRMPAFAGMGVTLNGLPAEFWRYYADNDCLSYDPIDQMVRTTVMPFEWDKVGVHKQLTRKQVEFMRVLNDLGVRRGVAMPLRGQFGLHAIVGLASSQRYDATEPNLDLLDAVVTQFYAAHKKLEREAEACPDPPASAALGGLSAKEQEVLTWMAAGKTDGEIATILSITPHTVNAHARNIYRKLGAHNRVKAVVLGIMNGLVNL